jgi:hypothetical protein
LEASRSGKAWAPILLALLVAVQLAVVDVAVRLPMLVVKSVDTDERVRTFKATLPADAAPVSVGPVHHRFAFYYREPIRLVSRPQAAREVKVGEVFFLANDGPRLPEPPFAYDRLDVVACDRNVKQGGPVDYVVIGRRRPETAAVHTESAR